jgi:hypothetical protein
MYNSEIARLDMPEHLHKCLTVLDTGQINGLSFCSIHLNKARTAVEGPSGANGERPQPKLAPVFIGKFRSAR